MGNSLLQRYTDTVFEHLCEIYDKRASITNISTCVNIIDTYSGGISNGTITTIFGFTGSRKNNLCHKYSI